MRALQTTGLLLSALLLSACEPPPQGVTYPEEGPSSGPRIKRPAGVAAQARLNMLRDPRCRDIDPKRTRSIIIVEAQGLESVFAAAKESAPGRTKVAERLADVYADLNCVAYSDAAKALDGASEATTNEAIQSYEEDAARAVKLAGAASTSAIKYLTFLRSKQSETCGKAGRSLPGATCTDAIVYYSGLNHEHSDNLDAARRQYFNVIDKSPSSPFVSYSYFAFGWLFLQEAPKKRSSAELTEQSFNEFVKRGGKTHPLFPHALVGLGMSYALQKQGERAMMHFAALGWLAKRDPKGTADSAVQLFENVARVAVPTIKRVEQACDTGEADACMAFGDTLMITGDESAKKRAVSLFVKSCDAGIYRGCSRAATAFAEGDGTDVDEPRARALYQKGCDGAFAASCAELGRFYESGVGGAKDRARAVPLFIRACEGDFAPSCRSAGVSLLMGYDIAKDEPRGATLLEKGCNKDHRWSCVAYGMALEQGRGVKQDSAKAKEVYARYCNNSDSYSCAELGALQEREGTPDALRAALTSYASACKDHDSASCDRLGAMFEGGRGTAKDEARAAEHFKRSCELAGGSAHGCFKYAEYLAQGRTVAKDEAAAAIYYTRACDQGDARGCYQVGKLFPKGADPEKEAAKAAPQYTKDCTGGNAKACESLGLLYGTGFGVPLDDTRANELLVKACDGGQASACYVVGARLGTERSSFAPLVAITSPYFQKACDGGNMAGCSELGVLKEFGIGSKEDPAAAAALFTKACDGGSGLGCRRLGNLTEAGKGVPKDQDRASTLFKRACTLGDYGACKKAP